MRRVAGTLLAGVSALLHKTDRRAFWLLVVACGLELVSSLGGYNLDVDVLGIVQTMQMIMNSPGRLNLGQTWRRDAAEFARPSVAPLPLPESRLLATPLLF
jgi:hypothetical protein